MPRLIQSTQVNLHSCTRPMGYAPSLHVGELPAHCKLSILYLVFGNHAATEHAPSLHEYGIEAGLKFGESAEQTGERRGQLQSGAEFFELSPFKRNNFPLFIGLTCS